MKAEKKHVGTKAQIRAEKERGRRVAAAIILAIILASAALSAYFGYTILNPSTPLNSIEPTLQFKPENPNPKLKAAIVDQLSLTFPNQTFVEKALEVLTQAGFTVDYYKGEDVTVDFYYSHLASEGYAIILMRTHSAIGMTAGSLRLEGFEGLFSSENYSTLIHIFSQLRDELERGRMSEDGPEYFVVTPEYIKSSIRGRFPNTIIILMGCSSIRDTILADACVSRGALAVIGWNDLVTASHTDQATLSLLLNLVIEQKTIGQAVEETMNQVGRDPTYGAALRYYPSETGNLTIQNTINNITTLAKP